VDIRATIGGSPLRRVVVVAAVVPVLLVLSLAAYGGVASADEPCKVDCEPIVISPNPNPGEDLIIGPVIVLPDIVSIIGPQITFEGGIPCPTPTGITLFVGDGPFVGP